MSIVTYEPLLAEIIHDITVDMTKPYTSQPIRLVQGDASLPIIRVEATNNGQKIDLSSGYDEINLIVQNGEDYIKLETLGYAYDYLQGVIGCYFRVPRQITTTPGTYSVCLQLIVAANSGIAYSVTDVKLYVTKLASNELPPEPQPIPETPLVNLLNITKQTPTWIDGYYIRNNGIETSSTAYSHTDFIGVPKGKYLLVKYKVAMPGLPGSCAMGAYTSALGVETFSGYYQLNSSLWSSGYILLSPMNDYMGVKVNVKISDGYPDIYICDVDLPFAAQPLTAMSLNLNNTEEE